jgi:subtilisin-like proprotein convertase family protein
MLTFSDRVLIPDNQPTGVKTLRPCSLGGTIKRVELDLDIAHSYVGDLQVKLAAPGRPHIVLYDQAFSATPDLKLHFTSDDSKLKPLVGQAAQGDWIIVAADLSPGETGAIRGWTIKIETQGAGALAGFDEPSSNAVVRPEAVLLLNNLNDLVARLTHVIGR